MNDYLIIQEKLNHYSSYVKRMISGLCEEFQTNKIHLRRVTSVLERLFANEVSVFLDFFVDDKFSKPTQFIHYLSAQGEIFHMGNNEYSLPPERSIILPDKQNVRISSLELNECEVGLGQLNSEKSPIFLDYENYVFLPTFEQILKHYQNKLFNNHDIEPFEMITFTEKGAFKSSRFTNLNDREYYILKFERLIGSQLKLEHYFAQWRDNQWYVSEIKNSTLLRTKLALRSRKKLNSNYSFSKKENGFLEVNFQYSLPKEEDILLRLIATPIQNKWPKRYLSTESQLKNIREILSYCKMREVKSDGVHN